MVVKPTFALAIYIRSPFLVLFKNPFAQSRFPLVEWHIPMLGFFEHRHITGNSTFRANEVGSIQTGATRFTLIAIGMVKTTMRASAGHITVGQKLSRLFIVELLACLFNKLSFFIEFLKKITGS